MKKIFAFALMFLSYGNASYSKEYGALKQYCSQANTSNSSNCLFAYLAYRCTANFVFSDPLFVPKCIEGVRVMVKELDSSTGKLKLHEVAFSAKLLRSFLMPVSNIKKRMNQYQAEFEESYRFSKNHSFWERSLLDAHQSKEKALETIVTLFQDFSSKGYFQFVDDQTRVTSANIQLLAQHNLNQVNAFYDELVENRVNQNQNPTYTLYPELKDSEKLSALTHHFYTPAYLALRLKKQGVDPKVAYYLSFLFNTSYEFIKLDQKMKMNRWPYRDPVAFNAQVYALQVQKIYTGYIGALWGVGMESEAIPFEQFSRRLAANPSSFIRALHEQ